MPLEAVVDASELTGAIALFRKFLRSKKAYGEALVTVADEKLRIELGGMAQSIRASGDWPGEARFSGHFLLLRVPQSLPEPRVTIEFENGTLTLPPLGGWRRYRPRGRSPCAAPRASLSHPR